MDELVEKSKLSWYQLKLMLIGCYCETSGSNAIHVGLKVRENYSGKVRYEPGDHIGVFATNNKTLVDGLVERLSKSLPGEGPLQLQVLREQKGLIIFLIQL